MSRPILPARSSHDWSDEILLPQPSVQCPPCSSRQGAVWTEAFRSRMYLVVVGIAYLAAVLKVIVSELLVEDEEDTRGSSREECTSGEEDAFSRESLERRAIVKPSGFDSRKLLRPEFGQTFKVRRVSACT
eukprot:763916-Hanusia_phi.AAC.1